MLSPAFDPAAHAVQFMQVAQQGTTLTSRDDLRRWLGGEVQRLLPHDALLAATGDFRRGDVRVDLLVVQPAQTLASASALMPLAHALRDGWIADDQKVKYYDILRRLFMFFYETYLDQEHGFLDLRDEDHLLCYDLAKYAGGGEWSLGFSPKNGT